LLGDIIDIGTLESSRIELLTDRSKIAGAEE
jgi:hypothetical protein